MTLHQRVVYAILKTYIASADRQLSPALDSPSTLWLSAECIAYLTYNTPRHGVATVEVRPVLPSGTKVSHETFFHPSIYTSQPAMVVLTLQIYRLCQLLHLTYLS